MREKYFSVLTVNTIIVLTLTILCFTAFPLGGLVTASSDTQKAVYYGNTEGNKVTLMINVYWGTEYVLPMAELFKKYGFNTTFFIGGSWADDNAEIVRQLYDMGFELGNHGYFHKNHSQLSYQQNREEIIMTERMLQGIVEAQPAKLFAPPSGYLGTNMYKVCDAEGYKVIMWSRDTIDWRDKDSDLVYKRAVKDIKGGDLILMHPTEHTLKALPKILDQIKAKNLEAATVSENLSENV